MENVIGGSGVKVGFAAKSGHLPRLFLRAKGYAVGIDVSLLRSPLQCCNLFQATQIALQEMPIIPPGMKLLVKIKVGKTDSKPTFGYEGENDVSIISIPPKVTHLPPEETAPIILHEMWHGYLAAAFPEQFDGLMTMFNALANIEWIDKSINIAKEKILPILKGLTDDCWLYSDMLKHGRQHPFMSECKREYVDTPEEDQILKTNWPVCRSQLAAVLYSFAEEYMLVLLPYKITGNTVHPLLAGYYACRLANFESSFPGISRKLDECMELLVPTFSGDKVPNESVIIGLVDKFYGIGCLKRQAWPDLSFPYNKFIPDALLRRVRGGG
ncbi:MAG: hypothetical protein WC890_04210 [Candidatus Margulisiibacteriota bacterium]